MKLHRARQVKEVMAEWDRLNTEESATMVAINNLSNARFHVLHSITLELIHSHPICLPPLGLEEIKLALLPLYQKKLAKTQQKMEDLTLEAAQN